MVFVLLIGILYFSIELQLQKVQRYNYLKFYSDDSRTFTHVWDPSQSWVLCDFIYVTLRKLVLDVMPHYYYFIVCRLNSFALSFTILRWKPVHLSNCSRPPNPLYLKTGQTQTSSIISYEYILTVRLYLHTYS
jgi:hypothetical protein